LDDYERDGLIKSQRHPIHPYIVVNYTPRCQARKCWDWLTIIARGLVLDENGRIIVRPFPKFFSFEEWIRMGIYFPRKPYTVFEKLDGSLITVSWQKTGVLVTSRGSFVSPHVKAAKELLSSVYGTSWVEKYPGKTFCFELLHPHHRVVIDYGPEPKLVLLAWFDTATGEEHPLEMSPWPGPVIKTLARDQNNIHDTVAFAKELPSAYEGVVIRYADGTRLKIKSNTYQRLHSLLTQLNVGKIWDVVCHEGEEGIERLIHGTPALFQQWVRRTIDELVLYKEEIVSRVESLMNDAPSDKRAFVDYVKSQPPQLQPILFARYHGKDWERLVNTLVARDTILNNLTWFQAQSDFEERLSRDHTNGFRK